jgi:hypothetical protein
MIAQSHAPPEFLCPITTEVMEDPVILADGRSYERVAICRWLASSQRSPMTGESLEHIHALPNVNLRALIEDWKETHIVEAAIREEETALQEMPRSELAELRTQLEGAFQQEDGLTLVIERVQLVYNTDLQRAFQRKQAEIVQLRGDCPVVTRYHGTTPAAAVSIAQQGFQMPLSDDDGDFVGKGLRVYYTEEQKEAAQEHAGDMLMFGQAVYVSKDLEKATRFAQGAVVLCRCALGKQMVAKEAQHSLTWAQLQAQGYDSVNALGGCQENGGCRFAENALYHTDQVLPTHVVNFRLVKTGGDSLVAQHLPLERRTMAAEHSLDSLLAQLVSNGSGSVSEIDERRISACKLLGDIGRDDQQKAVSKFLSDRKLISLLASCAKSPNEALQFEALRAWWNFSFNDQKVQALTMQQLGAAMLASLLDSPNASLRLRATGLIWNLTQHCMNSRQVFSGAGVLDKLETTLSRVIEEVVSSATPPWGVLQLLFGALANIALTCGGDVKKHEQIVYAGELVIGMDLITPAIVQQQVTRFVCNLICEGSVDPEWQEKGFSYRTSAPRDAIGVA